MAPSARAPVFSNFEKQILCDLVEKYKNEIESKKLDSATSLIKKKAWVKLGREFNSNCNVHVRDSKQLKRCWEKVKYELKRKSCEETKCQIGTGGAPSPRIEEDPLADQGEKVVPDLDVAVDTNFNTGNHHRDTALQSQPCTSSSVSPASSSSLSPLHDSLLSISPISPSSTFYLTLPGTPTESKQKQPSPKTHAATSSPPAAVPSSSCHPQKVTKQYVLQQVLQARLAAIEEARKQRLIIHNMMVKDLKVKRVREAEIHRKICRYHDERLKLLHLRVDSLLFDSNYELYRG